jgi:hypothetical protein
VSADPTARTRHHDQPVGEQLHPRAWLDQTRLLHLIHLRGVGGEEDIRGGTGRGLPRQITGSAKGELHLRAVLLREDAAHLLKRVRGARRGKHQNSLGAEGG